MSSSSQRAKWASRLIPLALLAASANAACVSLATSKVCPSYSTYSVDPSKVGWLNGIGITMQSFTDPASFDTAANGATGFLTSTDCTGYNATNHLAYQNTILCILLIQESNSCTNYNQAPNLCATSCTLYENSLRAMVTATCPKSSVMTGALTTLTGTCNGSNTKDWPSLQSTDTASCVNALTNENEFCGKSLFIVPECMPECVSTRLRASPKWIGFFLLARDKWKKKGFHYQSRMCWLTCWRSFIPLIFSTLLLERGSIER